MNENELFQAALGLLPPWLVSRCTFNALSTLAPEESPGRNALSTLAPLDIHLDFPRGSVFAGPVCGVPSKAYDTTELTWRHLWRKS